MPDEPGRSAEVPEDPTGIEEPHDVLAAEEFAMPARSPGEIPPDPTGIPEPHDVLAAEEFAMPTPSAGPDATDGGSPAAPWLIVGAFAAGVALSLALRRLRS